MSVILTLLGLAASAAPPLASTSAPLVLGKALSAGAATQVGDVLAAPAKYAGKNLKLSGKISRVCQKRGCWFELAPSNTALRGVRIRSAEYNIFVPLDSAGRSATAEGKFTTRTLSDAEASHDALDLVPEGKSPPPASADRSELLLSALGVVLE